MRRHVPATAQSGSNALWITDDLLAEAYHRFARVSNTRTCRRYGSNIPDPLEARRRDARRRLGLAAAVASEGPPTIDIGALFGLGARPPTQPEKSWKWEPPSLPPPKFGVSPPPPPPQSSVWPSLALQRDERTQQLPEVVHDPPPAVEASKAASRDLQSRLQHLKKVDERAMQQIVAFLGSPEDEPKALNVLSLTDWLSKRDIQPEVLYAMAQCLCDKVRLRTLDESQHPASLAFLLNRIETQAPNLEAILAETLDALPAGKRHRTVTRLSQHIRTSYRSGDHGAGCIRTLFRVLDLCQSMRGSHIDHSTWAQVYRRFAVLLKPAQLAAHLCSLDRVELAQLLLRYWVPRYLLLADGRKVEPDDHESSMHFSFRLGVTSRSELHGLALEFDRLWSPATVRSNEEPSSSRPNDPLVDLIAVLAKGKIHYSRFLQDLFDMLGVGKSRADVWETFKGIRSHSELGVSITVARKIVQYLGATGSPTDLNLAWRVFKAVPSLSVLHCSDLPMQLVEHGLGTPHRIFSMLNRKVGPEIALPEFRDTRRLALQPARIDLVHLVAYAWANQKHTSSRVAFRRVWETYRFLQDRGAPLSVLMSRSLVKAGILRPMQEGKDVSLAQLKYIISLVQRLEGDNVAASLDRLVFPINKRLRDPNNPAVLARRKWWAGRMDDGIARAIKWRLRLWTRRKGMWYDADGPIAKASQREKSEQGFVAEGEPLEALRQLPDDTVQHSVWRREVDELITVDCAEDSVHGHLEDDHEPNADHIDDYGTVTEASSPQASNTHASSDAELLKIPGRFVQYTPPLLVAQVDESSEVVISSDTVADNAKECTLPEPAFPGVPRGDAAVTSSEARPANLLPVITKMLWPAKPDIPTRREKPRERRSEPAKGHMALPERGVNASKWQAFGLQWYERRKRRGYGPHVDT